jgi:tetraacyldisaccharide 4'-kinase
MASKRNRRERIEKFLLRIVEDGENRADDPRFVKLLLILLKQLSHLYRAVVQLRLFLYDKRVFRHHTLGCQVISVGNLTVGGTGKTPVVEIFARRLQQEGRRVAILSRGYKKKELPFMERLSDRLLLRERSRPPRVVSDGKTLLLDSTMSGDEPYMLASHLPDVAVLVDRNRVKSGQYAIKKLGCDTLVLDDGFQYLSLKHQLDIVLVDKRNPFGNGKVLPRGILREPIRNFKRADFILITKCDGTGNGELKARLRELNSQAEIIECSHKARYLKNAFSPEKKELDFLKDLPVTAMTGIAAPAGFVSELEHWGAKIVCSERFADHHKYSQQELIDIINKSRDAGVAAIITTEKDAVRFPRVERRDVPIFFLRVDIELLSGTEDFDDCISRICFRRPERVS